MIRWFGRLLGCWPSVTYTHDSRGTRNIDCKEKSNGRLIIIISRFECIGWFFSIKVALTRSIVYISISLVTRSRATISRWSTILRQKFEGVSECTARLFKFYWSQPRKKRNLMGGTEITRTNGRRWPEGGTVDYSEDYCDQLLLSTPITCRHWRQMDLKVRTRQSNGRYIIIMPRFSRILCHVPPCKTRIRVQLSEF